MRLSLLARFSSDVASRIASRLNPAIETAVDVNTRFKTRFESYSFSTLIRLVSIPIGIAYVSNIIPYLTKGDSQSTFFGWRVLAHLGPYHVPHLVENGRWRKALETLSHSQELQLIESEIAQLLTDIEVVTQRRMAVRRIVKSEGMKIFLPIINNLSAPPSVGTVRKGQSHFEANLRVAMDVVSATPANNREVPISTIEALITNNKESWEADINEDTKRFREYRAVLLLKLLQNDENLNHAKNSRIINEFLTNELTHAQHQVFPTLPLMPLLYQFKTEKLGFEYVDIVRKLLNMVNIETDNTNVRKSLKLQHKIDFINFEKLVYLTICYASLRVVPMISEYSFKVLSKGGSVVARSVIGAALLEAWYRGEEHLIQSAPWYDSTSLVPSACMGVSNIVFGAFVLRFFPFCGLPWLMMRIRDSFADSYRFL